jgi:hypothetical protein
MASVKFMEPSERRRGLVHIGEAGASVRPDPAYLIQGGRPM